MAIDFKVLPEYQTWYMLHEVDAGIMRSVENELRPFGISPIAAGVLYIVKYSSEPVTLSELSRWLFRERHTISELIGRMAKQGLVKKMRSRHGKGMVSLELTKKGSEVLDQYWKEMKVVRNIVSCLSKEETDNLMACLDKLKGKIVE
ncbi:MAG: MarR family transcriptional regulator [Chloroflexota bacterium]|nr:MarR family transcriptional regulator [Chloroflexota bacterium]